MGTITLKQSERQELRGWVRGQSRDAAQARRARLILMLADRERYGTIREKLSCDTNFIARWKSRFVTERLAGLYSRHSGRVSSPTESAKKLGFLGGRCRKNPRTGPLTGVVESWRWNWAMSRT